MDLTLSTAERSIKLSEEFKPISNILPLQTGEYWTSDHALTGWTPVEAVITKINPTDPYIAVKSAGVTDGYNVYCKTEMDVEATTEAIEFSFDYAYAATTNFSAFIGKVATSKVAVSFQLYSYITSKTYYLDNKKGWTETLSRLTINEVKADMMLWGTDQVPTWYNYKILANGFPENGKLTIKLYGPVDVEYTDDITGTAFKNIKCAFLYENKALPSGTAFELALNNSTKADKKEISFTGGDVPDLPNNKLSFTAYTSLYNDVLTGQWTMPGITGTDNLLNIISKLYGSENRSAKQYLTGSIRGQLIDFDTVLLRSYPTSRKFEIIEASYNLCADRADVVLAELFDYAETSFDLIEEEVSGSSSSTSSFNGSSFSGSIHTDWSSLAGKPFDALSSDDFEVTDEKVVKPRHIFYNPDIGQLETDCDLYVAGKIRATKEIMAWLAGELGTTILDTVLLDAPLCRISSNHWGFSVNTSQFEIVAGALQIKSNVLTPASHSHYISDVFNLQNLLDAKWSSSNHPLSTADYGLPAYPTTLPASDVPSWAKEVSKPSYSFSEITSTPNSLAGYGIQDAIDFNDYRLSNARPASDVPAWAKEALKPSYDWSEIGSKPTWTEKFGWDSGNNRVTLSSDIYITGKIWATGEIMAWVVGAVGTTVLANLTATYPLYKSTDSNIQLLINSTQFEVNGSNQLQIKSGILAPAAHYHVISDVTGLQGALDGKFSTPSGLTTNYLPKWNGSSLGNSLISDNGTSISLGGTLYLNSVNGGTASIGNAGDFTGIYGFWGSIFSDRNGETARIYNGNFFVGYTSDPASGNKFAVNGNAYIGGSVTATSLKLSDGNGLYWGGGTANGIYGYNSLNGLYITNNNALVMSLVNGTLTTTGNAYIGQALYINTQLAIHAGNIGTQSVNYATSANYAATSGDASTVGGYSPSAFLILAGGNQTMSGSLTAYDFILSSDARLKRNIEEYNPVRLNTHYKSFNMWYAPKKQRFGVIAQELLCIAPEHVHRNITGYYEVSYIDLFCREHAWEKYMIDQHEQRFLGNESKMKMLEMQIEGLQNQLNQLRA